MVTQQVAQVHQLKLLSRSDRLRHRKLETLPVEKGIFVGSQGRGWGTKTTTAPSQLVDLITSIGTSGVLQPILCEEVDGQYRVVSGHRRLAACRWGAVNVVGNSNFTDIPAIVVPGPLSEEERRAFQLIENLGRADLQPGELAAALLYERCAVLAELLAELGDTPPKAVTTLEDPLLRWDGLEQFRVQAGYHSVGAPWTAVLKRLGMEMSADRCKQLYRAFRSMPPEVSLEMDAAEIALSTRQDWARLHKGSTQAALDIWAAVQEQDPTLLRRAVIEATQHPTTDPQQAVAAASAFRSEANAARSESQRRTNPYSAPTTPDAHHVVEAAINSLQALAELIGSGAALSSDITSSLRQHLVEALGVLEGT